MDGTELAQRLDELTSGEPPPVPAWDDLARGRAARGRRRARATLGIAGVAAASVIATGLWLAAPPAAGVDVASSSGESEPDLLGWPDGVAYLTGEPKTPTSYVGVEEASATVPEYAPERVTAAEAVDRCLVALADDVPNATADPADISAVGPLYAGDHMELPLWPRDPDDDADLGSCGLVLGPLTPPTSAVLPDGATAADDVDVLLEACSGPLQIDVTGWTVSTAMADGYGGIAATLVSPRQNYGLFCSLQPADGSGGAGISIENHSLLPELHAATMEARETASGGTLLFNAGYSPCYPKITECAGEGNSLTGVLPAGMESATVVFADGTEIPVPVGVHGTFAIRFVCSPGDDPHLRTFDADGVEVGTWSMRQG